MYCMQGIYAMISAVTMSGLGCYTSLRYLNCAQPPLDIVSKLLDPGLPLKRQFTLLGNGSLPPLQQCFSLAFWKLEGGGRGRGEEGGVNSIYPQTACCALRLCMLDMVYLIKFNTHSHPNLITVIF